MYDLKTIAGWKEHLVLHLNIDNIVKQVVQHGSTPSILLSLSIIYPDNLLEESLQQIYLHIYLHIYDQSVSLFKSHQHSSDQMKILKD